MKLFSSVNKKVTFLTVILFIPFVVGFGVMKHWENQPPGGTLYVALPIPFYDLDVLGGAGLMQPEMTIMNNLLLERLFALGPTGDIVPELGLSATPSADGLYWDIKLRQNVRFHDYTPFNADAVVDHWKRILNPANNFRGRYFFQPLEDVEKIDEYTVRFVLEHPWGPFLNVISDEVYSFAYIPSPNAVLDGSHREAPVGTGSFRFDAWNKGDHFSVARNENYWREGEPYLERIVFRHIPDPQTRYAALMSSQVDVITLDRGTIIQRAVAKESLAVYPSNGNGAEIVLINTSKPPLDDVRVRRALALANDQNLHVQMVYQGSIPNARHPFGEGFGCTDNDYPEHDTDKAKALISDYGRPVKIECLHSDTLRGRNIGELLQQLFGRIDVELNPVGVNPAGSIMKVVEKDFQLATWRILSARDYGAYLYRMFHSESPANWSGYQNPEMDALLEAQRREPDPYKRQAILCDIAKHLNREAVILYRGGRRFHLIANNKLQGVASVGEMMDLSLAWIKGQKINVYGRQFELAAKSPIDCSDPGDIEAVRRSIVGKWQGKDNFGATIRGQFAEDGQVNSSRKNVGATVEYTICGDTIFWRPPGALLVVQLENDQLAGHWEYAGYTGEFTLQRVPVDDTE